MRKQFFFIAFFLCSTFLTATAQKIVVKDIEGPTVRIKGDLRDIMYADHSSNSSLKARRYADPADPVISYKDRITNMPQYLHDFIDKYVEAGNAVLAGGSSWLSNPSLGEVDTYGRCYYLLKKITGTTTFYFSANSSSTEIKQAAETAYKNLPEKKTEEDLLSSFSPYAFLSLNFDHPEFFWIGNAYDITISGTYGTSYYPGSDHGDLTYTVEFRFYLRESGFDIRNGGIDSYDFQNTTNIANGVQTFNNSVETILTECMKYPSRYDKLVAAHDWLTLHNRYNPYFPNYSQSQIGDTPWCAFSAIKGSNGQEAPVCEGYSRAFKVLCDAMDIPCIIMSGKTSYRGSLEDHMWNYVQMENGKWYAIDVTWDDPAIAGNYNVVSGSESHEWFLLGSTTKVEDGVAFIESHPEQWFENYPSEGSYSWELRPGPELSLTAWNSVVLEKCATPTISYVNGKLKFSCETEGVKFFSSIKDDDIRSYNDKEEISLGVTYTITVYASKSDHESSDIATATLCWIDQTPSTEGITDEDAVTEVRALPVLIQSKGGVVTVQGAADGTPVSIYDIDGKRYGTIAAERGSSTIATTLRPGSVAIVKIGEKSVKVVIE